MPDAGVKSMVDREHTSTHYDEQLSALKEKLLLISSQAERMVADSLLALTERRPSLAQEVIDRDDTVDKLELEIDDLCFEVLAREQPVACDLRVIAASLKIVKDVERIGDTAVNIAERVIELSCEPEMKPIIDLSGMANTALHSLKESFDSFVNSDPKLAAEVIRKDRILDNMYEQTLRALLTYMLEDSRVIPRAVSLIFLAKHLERLGDHAANIAEMAVFLASGEDIRHSARFGPARA